MRTLIEVIVVAALIGFGWERSFKERAAELPVVGKLTAAGKHAPVAKSLANSSASAQTTAASSGGWMWDANRRGVLDKPKPGQPTTPP
jgi:hypothetical protein